MNNITKAAIIIGVAILFITVCITVLFLFRRTLYNMIDRRIERFQSELIEKQVREIQNMYRQVRGWRHDYRNHINNMKIQLSEGNYDKLSMSDVELCSMLGNILDNAVEACGTLPEEERFMRVYIGKLKGQLYLSVQNSAGKVRKSKNTYLSTKEGEHGYGLFRIDRVAKKYGGYVNRQNEEGVFATEIMVPLCG